MEVEQYEAESERDGYYSKADQMISVTSKAWYYSRERMLEILLHEVNHAYTQAVADSVNWEDQYEDDHTLRMYADAYIFKTHRNIILRRRKIKRSITIMPWKLLPGSIRRSGSGNILNILMRFHVPRSKSQDNLRIWM